MKAKKLLFTLCAATPAVILPISLTSCAIYTDCLKGYTPTYSQLTPASYTAEEGANSFFEKGKNINNFIKEEFLWGSALVADKEISKTIEGFDDLTYKAKFSTFQVYCEYGNIVDSNEHRISYKITTDIQEDIDYYYKGVKTLQGVCHYQVQWECKNLRFDAKKCLLNTTPHWLIKPVMYDGEDTWTDGLDEKESLAFNVRYINEIYKNGIQMYGYEATEAATMSQGHEYVSELVDVINYFCCFISYSLDTCTFVE